MKSLINRISWIVSILAWVIIWNVLSGWFLYSVMWTFWSVVISGAFIGTIIKVMLFDEKTISRAIFDIEQNIYSKLRTNSTNKFESVLETNDVVDELTNEIKSENISDITNEEDNEEVEANNNFWYYNDNNASTEEVEQSDLVQNYEDESSKNAYNAIVEDTSVYEESKIRTYIKNFFAENALAKIGGILLFLWAMFFVGLIYINAGWAGKMLIWLILWIVVYLVWIYLDKKWLSSESQICMGTWIAINYLVILWARYLIQGGWFIAEGTTFIFLIINTLLAIVTGMIYRSNTILVFGFLLAYFNPMLIWAKSTSPIFVSTYAAIVSMWAIWLSYYTNNTNNLTWSTLDQDDSPDIDSLSKNNNISNNLLWIALLGWMATFVLSLVWFWSYRFTQIIYISIIWVASVVMSYILWSKKQIISFVFIVYICILIVMFLWYSYINNPYILGIYIFTLFVANVYLSSKIQNKLGDKSISNTLSISSFVLSMVALVSMPFDGNAEWIFKLAVIVITSIVSIYIWSTQFKMSTKDILIYIIWSYLAIMLSMILWFDGLAGEFVNYIIYISYVGALVSIGWYTIYLIYNTVDEDISMLLLSLFMPLMILLISLWIGINMFIIPSLLIGFVIMMAAILLLWDRIGGNLKYILFGWLGMYIFVISVFLNFLWLEWISLYQDMNIWSVEYISTIIASFVLLIVWYKISTQKDMQSLYPMATLMHILILLPILHGSSANMMISVWATAATLLVNIVVPLLSDKLSKSTINTTIWLILWWLFVLWEVYRFDMMYDLVYGWLSITGLIYIWLALIYILSGVFMIYKSENTSAIKDSIYTYMWIWISALTIALSFIFADNMWILTLSWMSLATVILYIYSRVQDDKIYVAGLIMLIISTYKLFAMTGLVSQEQYWQLVPLGLVLIFDIFWLYFVRNKKNPDRVVYDILHFVVVLVIWYMIYTIVPIGIDGLHMLIISALWFIIGVIYSKIHSGYTKYIYIVALIVLGVAQLINIWQLSGDYSFLQYISTALIAGSAIIQYKSTKWFLGWLLLTFVSIYLFIITTIYIYDVLPNTFVTSIYRWVIAYILLHLGISNDQIQLRTIWLYIIWITLLKIWLYDIWYGINSGMMRVVALILLGALLIYISTLYSSKYGGKMSGELDPNNIFGDKFDDNNKNNKEIE